MEYLGTVSDQTMSSIDLRSIINEARQAHGESVVRNDDMVKRIEDELYGELGGCKTFAHPQSGASMRYYDLTIDQCLLVGMRESKSVRRSVLGKVKNLESQREQIVPTTYIEALQALIESEKQKQLAIDTKAEIGNRREATAMNTASTATKRANKLEVELDESKMWSTVKRMEMITGLRFDWRKLKAAESDLGYSRKDVYDANYGTVRSYHADAWQDAYALDIDQ